MYQVGLDYVGPGRPGVDADDYEFLHRFELMNCVERRMMEVKWLGRGGRVWGWILRCSGEEYRFVGKREGMQR